MREIELNVCAVKISDYLHVVSDLNMCDWSFWRFQYEMENLPGSCVCKRKW